MKLNYIAFIQLISILTFFHTSVMAQELEESQYEIEGKMWNEFPTNEPLFTKNKEAKLNINFILFQCDTVKQLNINLEEVLLEENRHQYISSKDTLLFIYCNAEKTNNDELKANSLAKLAAFTINNENDDRVFERFISILNSSIQISENNNLKIPLANAYELLCSNLTQKKMFDIATIYANKFIEISNKFGDSVLIAEGHMHLGRILREQGDYFKSDSILNVSLKHLADGQSSHRIGAWTYLHLANLKRLEGNYSKSVEYGKKGIALAEKVEYYRKYQIANLSTEIILSNLELGIFDNEEWLEKLNSGIPTSKWLKGYYEYIVGVTYENNNQDDKAIDSYLDAIRISNEVGSFESTFFISEKILPLLSKNDISPRAIEVYQISQNAIKKILEENASNDLLYDAVLKLEYEKHKKNLLQQKLVYSHRIILFSTSLIVLFLALIILIIRQNKKVRKLNSNINRLNIDLLEKNASLEESQKNLQASNKRLSLMLDRREKVIQRLQKFASVLAHDFKEPVRVIVSFGKLLKRSIPSKINKSENEFLDFVISSTERLYSMVDRLYQYSNNTLALMNEFQVIDLDVILKNVEKDLVLMIHEKKGQVNIQSFDYNIIGDNVLIYQLFQNLISNALKYSKDDIPSIIKVESRIEDDYLMVSISDNGIGIKETPNLNIFALFSRASEVMDKGGHGLGLATCKEVVEIHGGKIDYRSKIGIGTTFNIWFKDFQVKDA